MVRRLRTTFAEVFSSAAAIIMGSADLTTSTAARRRQANHSTRDSASRASPDTGKVERSGVDISRRPQSNEVPTDHKKVWRNTVEVMELETTSGDVVAEFKTALAMCENDLEQEKAKSEKLARINHTARKINQDQADRIKCQAEIIQVEADTIAQRDDNAKSLINLLDNIVDSHLSPYALNKGAHPETWSREAILQVTSAMSKDAANSEANAAKATCLMEQVLALQRDMFAKVERIHVASDEQFAQEFRVVVALVKSLSRTVRLIDTVDTADVLGVGTLLNDVSPHHWTGRSQKKLLTEAWIWSILIDKVFRTPFAVFGKQCDILGASWQSMYMDHCNGWPKPTALSETWRYTTIESLLDLVDRETITNGKEQDVTKRLDAEILALRAETLNTIGRHLSRVSSIVPAIQHVQNIVDKAFSFAIQMAAQRVRLQVTWPKLGDKFDADTMKCIPDPDGEDCEDGTVAFIVNPGLTKWGDAHGKNLDHRYDIVPSLVHCEVAHKQEVAEPESVARVWANVVKHGLKIASQSKREPGKRGESQR